MIKICKNVVLRKTIDDCRCSQCDNKIFRNESIIEIHAPSIMFPTYYHLECAKQLAVDLIDGLKSKEKEIAIEVL